MPDWPGTAIGDTQVLEIERDAALAQLEILSESLADVELALEDQGWLALSMQAAQEFTREGRRRASALTRILAVQNPLVKRGIAIRTGYIWGGGLEVRGRAEEVNTVVQKFRDDNKKSLSSSQAREESEKSLATDGGVFRALVTSPLTGRVRVRTIDPDEIEDVICNPEDRDEPWFYLRSYVATQAGQRYAGITRTNFEQRRVLYPALGFRPTARMKTIDGIEVRWDQPVQHIAANRIDGWAFGIGDAYAAIAWARAYKEFLEDWARIAKSLSRISWQVVSEKRSSAQTAAGKIAEAARANGGEVGATAVMAGSKMEAISKSGATIDAGSGKPLAGMVAAALGVPVTMLLADPGVTGARATAETLDAPTRNEMNLRRELWADAEQELYDYVIDQAVKAPRGPLRGTIEVDEYGDELITLAGDLDRTIDIDWPDLDDIGLDIIMKAIDTADGMGKIPGEIIARWILAAMNEKNIDEILDELTDDDGKWVGPDENLAQALIDRHNDGNPPTRFDQPPAADDEPAEDATA
jgi:hypothetical protein